MQSVQFALSWVSSNITCNCKLYHNIMYYKIIYNITFMVTWIFKKKNLNLIIFTAKKVADLG